MEKARKVCSQILIALFLIKLLLLYPSLHSEAAQVASFDELKSELEKTGTATIELSENIRISAGIRVKGTKKIRGNGFSLVRDTRKQSVYGGSLLIVKNAQLQIEDLEVSGEGKQSSTKGKIYGRLIEVSQGTVVMNGQSVLKQNINTTQVSDGGGAVLVKQGGAFQMNGGEIRENKNVTCGAGVRIEKGGIFVITAGKITNNCVQGAGAYETFDGRGGGIYNAGTVEIQGGFFSGNQALHYTQGNVSYGGVGGMMFNIGTCIISGGTIGDNISSFQGNAIYTANPSQLEIAGGTIKDNIVCEGTCTLLGTPKVSTLQLKGNVVVNAKQYLAKDRVLLIPDTYKKERCLVKGKGNFVLPKQMKYQLEKRKAGIYLVCKRKVTQKKKEEKLSVVVTKEENEEIFPISKNNKSIKEESKKQKKRKIKFTFKKTKRYLFLWQVKDYTEEQWRQELKKGCSFSPNKKDNEFLWQRIYLEWDGLLENKPGVYTVGIQLRWKKQRIQEQLQITIVGDVTTTGRQAGEVRFYRGEVTNSEAMEIWEFSEKDIQKIKEFTKKQKNPFSQECNQKFMEKFAYCNKGRLR